MLAAISGKPCHSDPVCRKRNVRLTSTALRVFSVERLGRMRTSLKSSFTSVSMRMTDPACAGKRISPEFSDCGRKPQRPAFLGGNAMEDRAMADELVLYNTQCRAAGSRGGCSKKWASPTEPKFSNMRDR